MSGKKKFVSRNKKAQASRRVTVDIVTGKEVVSVYFDPAKSSDFDSSNDDSLGENLFIPASIVKDEGDTLLVRVPNGDVYRMLSDSLVRVSEQDDEGVDDILKLRDFSEKSLIHTLRVRYAKDDIYTFGTKCGTPLTYLIMLHPSDP
jgi:hypothetical protein